MARHANCEGVSRRDCLQLGLGTLAGGSFLNLLGMQANAANSPARLPVQAKSCILIWLDGGPTHYETFDPKPDAPSEVRGEFSDIATSVNGVRYSQYMQRLAKIAHKTAVIRSIRHNQGNHGAGNHYMMTGAPPRIPVGCGAFVSFHPSLGSVTSFARGSNDGLPAYFSIPSMSRSGGPNFLGAKHAPFVVSDNPNSTNFKVRDVALPAGLTDDRFGHRTGVRGLIDRMRRLDGKASGDPVAGLDDYYQQGYQLINSTEAQKAFDINSEPDSVRDAYGRNSFGQRALLGRRLVEAGVPFITLYEGGWDHHRGLFNTCKTRLPTFDVTIATLIEDLETRGILDETLVLVLGEFGRTPKINKDAGRDHWANAMSVLMAGAGTPGGVVVGATDRAGYSAVENVQSPESFVSTVYSKLGIDPGQILHTPQGRPTHLVSDPTPIAELMS